MMWKRTGRVNIVHYVTRQYMLRNKKRTVTSFIGILFMVLLMTCVFVGRDTAVAFLQEAASAREGKWHYALENISGAQLDQIQNLDYISELEESVGLGMTDFGQSKNEKKPYLNLKAYGEKCFSWYRVRLTEGHFPKQQDEIIISDACRSDGANVKIGDTVKASFFKRTFTGIQKKKGEKSVFPQYNFLEIGSGQTVEVPEQFSYYEPNAEFRENKEMTGITKEYTVVGFMEVPVYEKKDGAGYTALTFLDRGTLSGAQARNISIQIDFDRAPRDVYTELASIAGEEHVDANDYYLAFSGNSSDSTMNLMVRFLTVFFVAMIMAASVILIYNIFNLSYRERCRYLGMLSSVGATAKQKRSSVYYEAFLLLLCAMPAGIAAGFGVVKAGMALLKPLLVQFVAADGIPIEDIPVKLLVSWQGIAAAAAVSAVTVLLSAFLPARAISRRGAVESIRGNGNPKNRIYRMSRLVYKKNGAVKMLAANGLTRQGKKKRSISLSVTVFLVILIVTAFGADTVHTVLDKKVKDQTIMGIKLQEQEGILGYLPHTFAEETETRQMRERFSALKEELAQHSNVRQLTEWYSGIWCADVPLADFYSGEYMDAKMDIAKAYLGGRMSDDEIREQYFTGTESLSILVMDEQTLQDVAKRCGADGRILSDRSKMGVLAVDEVELSTDNMRYEGGKPRRFVYYDIAHVSDLKIGETFCAGFARADQAQNEQKTFTVAGYADETALERYVSMNGESTWIIMGTQTAQALVESLGYDDLLGMFEEDVKIEFQGDYTDLETDLLSMGQENTAIGYYNHDRLNIQKTMGQAIAEMVDIMLVCFVILTSVICFMNLGNAIGGRMADRRMEFAMMQSVGMTRRQIGQMLFLECCGILVSAVTAALLLSVFLILAMRYAVSSLFGRIVFQIPFGMILLAVALGAGSVCLMTFYSFGKEKAQNILEEIRRETV